jgi:hypothetical protein
MTFERMIHGTLTRVTKVRVCGAALAVLAICVLVFLPACKHKESPSNENSAAVPAPSPAATPAPIPAPTPAPDNAAQAQQPAQPQPIIVNAGTEITVRLTEKLGSRASQTGQTFSATVDKDVVVDGQTAIPAGSNVTGKVVSAKPFGQIAGEASVVLRLTSVNVNNTDQTLVTSTRSFGSKIKAKSRVKRFFGGLAKRAEGDEKEVVLAAQSAYTFTLKQAAEIQ